MAVCIDIPAGLLARLLYYHFPNVRFIPKKNNGVKGLDIVKYIVRPNGLYALDLIAMSGKRSVFSHLFHDEFSDFGRGRGKDVIRFGINVDNGRFMEKFLELQGAAAIPLDKDGIREKFFAGIDYYENKFVWEGWYYTKVINANHKPNKIYKAFCYYAHRYYTLLGFGLMRLYSQRLISIGKGEEDSTKKISMDKLLLNGQILLDEAEQGQFPELERFGVYRRTGFLELEQEVLESFQKVKTNGGSKVVPYILSKLEFFMQQLKSRMGSFMKNAKFDKEGGFEDDADTIDGYERKNIKTHMDKIALFITNSEDYSEYRRLNAGGTYREKVRFIHRQIQAPAVRANYDDREIGVIEGWVNMLAKHTPLQTPIKNNENKESSTVADTIADEKNIPPEIDFFKDEFKGQLDEEELTQFLQCVSQYLERNPSEKRKGTDGEIEISDYYKNKLFTEFCKLAGIEPDKQLKDFFFEGLQIILDNINRSNE